MNLHLLSTGLVPTTALGAVLTLAGPPALSADPNGAEARPANGILAQTEQTGGEQAPKKEVTEKEVAAEEAAPVFRLPAHISPNEQIEFFRTADYDDSGWISYEEAVEALLLPDRRAYQLYDTNADLRISTEEFRERYLESIRRTGDYRPPVPKATGGVAPPRTAEQLRNRFDRDLDVRLNSEELKTLVQEYDLPEAEAGPILARLDANQDGFLDQTELVGLSQTIEFFKDLPSGVFEENRPESLEELYGERIKRESTRGLSEPPQIRGPVRPYYRLDADGDEDIDSQDLFDLQFPLTLPVRANSVLAALDTNGNGSLDRAEFRAAME